MGYATIKEPLGEGLYLVTLDLGKARRDERVAALEERITKLQDELPDAEAALADAEAVRADLLVELNEAIEIWRAAVDASPDPADWKTEYDRLTEISTEIAEANQAVAVAQLKVTMLETEIATAQSARDKYADLEVERDQEAWCTDYTDDAAVDKIVETMEVPGEPQQIIIAPQAPVFVDAKGFLLMRELHTPEQLFFNAALLPGWQRWQPSYRIAIINLINDDNTLNVELEGTSSAQNLNINPPEPVGTAPLGELHNVPVDYMGAGADIFAVDDRVVVRINNYDWNDCTVIGFEAEPRPVAALLCHSGGVQYRVRPAFVQEVAVWSASAATVPGGAGVTYGRRGWTDGKAAVSWTDTIATSGDGVFYRGNRLMWWDGDGDNFGLYSVESHALYVRCAWFNSGRCFVALSVDNFNPPYLFNLEVVCFDVVAEDGALVGQNPQVIYQREIASDDFEIGASQSINGRSLLYLTRSHIIRLDFSVTDASVSVAVTAQIAGDQVASIDYDVVTHSQPSGSSDKYIETIDYSSSTAGSGDWVVGAVWSAAESGGLDGWQTIRQTRAYSRTCTFSFSGTDNSEPPRTYEWDGDSSSTEDVSMHFPWGSYTLVDVTQSWAGSDSAAVFEGNPLWIDDFIENSVLTRNVDRYPVVFCRGTMLVVSTGGEFEIISSGEIAGAGESEISPSSVFIGSPPPPQQTQGHPASVHTSVTSFMRPVPVPLEVRGLRESIIGSSCAYKNSVFFSVGDGGGGYINYMTDSPSLTGIFPDGVDLLGSFSPIVPY